MVALLFLGSAPDALAQNHPRADVVSCVRAVNDLDPVMWAKMRSHCLVIAANYCEASVSGPIFACLGDMTDSMNAFVATALPHLPDDIAGTGFTPRRYDRIITDLRAPDGTATRCAQAHGRAFDRARCAMIGAFSRLSDVFAAARHAGVTLP